MTASPYSDAPSVRARDFDVLGALRRRVLASIGATTGWLCLVLLYLAFWATRFTLFQSIVVVVVSLLMLAAILLGAWVSFGLGFARRWDR